MESAPSSALAICVALPKNVNALSLVAAKKQRVGRLAIRPFRQNRATNGSRTGAVDAAFLERPRFADELCATGGFLGGLEYDEHAALKFVEMRGDMAREAERHGHVSIVADVRASARHA